KRTFSSTALFAIVLWASVASIAVVHAGGGHQAQATHEPLNKDSLKTTLAKTGDEPKSLSKGHLLSIKQDTWTLNTQIVISADGRKIGLNANLGKIEDPSTVASDQWMKLLVSNGEIEPSMFYFDKDQKKLYLHRVFDNRSVGPASLRQEIERFCGHIRTTEPLWKFAK